MVLGSWSLPISLAGATHTASGVSLPLLRLWVELAFARRSDVPLPRKCLLDTGAPVCVIPLGIHAPCDFDWQPVPGPWPPGLTTWMGVPCIVGRIDIWIPYAEAPFLLGPLQVIAKFVQATPAQLPGNIPILLGLNFLADYLAQTAFQCHTLPHAGSIVLP